MKYYRNCLRFTSMHRWRCHEHLSWFNSLLALKTEDIALLFPPSLVLPLPWYLVYATLLPFQKHTFYGFCWVNFLSGNWNKTVGFWWGLEQVHTVNGKMVFEATPWILYSVLGHGTDLHSLGKEGMGDVILVT